MNRIQKTVGTMSVDITINNQKSGLRISGEVYPFTERFHAAKFTVCTSRQTQGEIEADVGCGGNAYSLADSTRMIAALKIAHDQASYYKNLIEALQDKDLYGNIVGDLIKGGDTKLLVDALSLTPRTTDSSTIEITLKELEENGKALGLTDSIKSHMTDAFYDTEGEVLGALFTLCSSHPKFRSEDEDMAKAADDFFADLEANGTFA